MIQLKDILAKSKPEETLVTHTLAVLEIWAQLRERYRDSISNEYFWRDSFYAIIFHDFGKICDNFQAVLRGLKKSSDDERIRHEFFSGMFLLANDHSYYLKSPSSLIAIFSHHKPFNDEGFNKHIRNNTSLKHVILENLIDEFIDFVNEQAEKYKIEKLKINEKLKYYISKPYSSLHTDYRRYFYDRLEHSIKLDVSSRNEYIKHKAILNVSDWTASGHIMLEPGLTFNSATLKDRVILKLKSDGKIKIAANFKFRDFQHEGINKGHVISIAPTGSGKTEAALLWATSKNEFDRIVYLLPTRVTSNAIFKRLCFYFGNDNVQLIHSSARLYLKDLSDGSYDAKKYFRDKSFFKNVNVCTVDQILTQGFNLGYWEVKTFHMTNSRIIIDEIHLYSPYTLGLIISTIKFLKDYFNATFYIMTATMPAKLLELLSDCLGKVDIVRDSELLNEARNTFETRDSYLDDLLEEVGHHIALKKKVLVVVNTVDKAIAVYDSLKETAFKEAVPIICYHSRFTNQDRVKKEVEIFAMDSLDKGGVLIATQVVEVSLDIDFDILFTENAPIDSIIQRAGRVNRKREKLDSQVIIARHFEVSEKVYDAGTVLNDTFSIFSKHNGLRLTENDLTAMVDEVYKNLNITGNKNYQDGLHKYFGIQNKCKFIKDLTGDEKVFTREGLNSTSVIPGDYYNNLYQEEDMDIFHKHEVSVPRRWTESLNSKKVKGFTFLEGKYDFETGFKNSKPKSVIIG